MKIGKRTVENNRGNNTDANVKNGNDNLFIYFFQTHIHTIQSVFDFLSSAYPSDRFIILLFFNQILR